MDVRYGLTVQSELVLPATLEISFVRLQHFCLFCSRLQHPNEDSINCSSTIVKSNYAGRFKPFSNFFLAQQQMMDM
jgi:hypothetical protein